MNESIKIYSCLKDSDGNESVKELTCEEDFDGLEKEVAKRELKERETICYELNTQDNRATSYPMFCVFEIVKLKDAEQIEVMREVFFTNKEAEQYIEECGHEHDGELFIYIKSGYRNEGWKFARESMLK